MADKAKISGWLWSILLHICVLLLLLYLSSYSVSHIYRKQNIINIDILSIANSSHVQKRKKIYIRKKSVKHKRKIKKNIKKQPVKITKKIEKKLVTKNNKKKINKFKRKLKSKSKEKLIKLSELRNLRLIKKRFGKAIEQIKRHKRLSAIFAIQKKMKVEIGQASKEKISYDKLITYLIQRKWKINNFILTKRNYYTIIKIVLAKSGILLKINDIKSSGNKYFDKTCEDAVRLAAPFPPYKFSFDRTNDIILTCRVNKNEIH